jgi:hypothetical protein
MKANLEKRKRLPFVFLVGEHQLDDLCQGLGILGCLV